MNQPFSNGGRMPKVADIRVVALYHPQTGKISHVHSVTVFEGGRAVDEKEAIETAKALAKKAGHATDTLAVRVSKDPMHGRKPHRIDVKTGEFVPLEMPKRGKAAASPTSR
jgi:hypothetical protein